MIRTIKFLGQIIFKLKKTIIIYIMILLIINIVIYQCLCYDFSKYVEDFKKNYPNEQIYAYRKSIYEKNMLQYSSNSTNIQQIQYGQTNFTDWTNQEFAQYCSSPYVQQNSSDQLPQIKPKSQLALDWRLSNIINPVEDQANCGSCWAFASVGIAQSFYALYNKKLLTFSKQYALQCTGKNNSCSGGYGSDVLKLIIPNGIPLESDYPYTSSYVQSGLPKYTRGICTTSTLIPLIGFNVKNYINVTNQQLVNLLQNSPVFVNFMAQIKFSGYKTGIYSCNSIANQYTINHQLQVIGYNKTGQYYIVKNSWGADWGMQGYAYISFTMDCGIKLSVYQITGPKSYEYPIKILFLLGLIILILI